MILASKNSLKERTILKTDENDKKVQYQAFADGNHIVPLGWA